MLRPLAFLASLWCGMACAQTVTTGAADKIIDAGSRPLLVRVGGRVKQSVGPKVGSRRGTVYAHQWPGVYFETAFEGEMLFLNFDDNVNEYRLLIDGGAPFSLKPSGQIATKVSGLGKKVHRVRLEKVTESASRIGKFGGFYVPQNGRVLPLRRPTRQIEFIGDSSMTGYGDRSSSTQCTAQEARALTDTQGAYPALLAKSFGADYQINAISGRGLIRNYAGSSPGKGMREIYPYVFFDLTEPYREYSWRPEIIIVRLIADFVTPLKPGERWKNMADLSAEYISAYGNFIRDLHNRSPTATILIWWPESAQVNDPAFAQMLQVAQRSMEQTASEAGVKRIAFFSPPGVATEGTACDHHFSLSNHRTIAAWIRTYLIKHPSFWDGT